MLQNVVGVSKEIIDKLSEIAPIIIIGAIWLFGAIAKAVAAGKKGQQPQVEQKARAKPHQPDFNDFVKIVRERYSAAREQVKRESQAPAVMPRPVPKPYQAPTPTPPPGIEVETPLVEVTIPSVQPKIVKPSTEQLVPSLAGEQLTEMVHTVEPHPYLSDIVEQYSDPDGLRKALLHYEILGTPLALRE